MKTKLLAVIAAATAIAACTAPEDEPHKFQLREPSATSQAIVGGTVVSDFSFPYVPMILWMDNPSNPSQTAICSGTLIDDFVVLTAAHCVADDPNPAHYQICGGDDPFGDVNQGGGCYWITGASEIHFHPQYDSQNLVNDVAVIILDAEPAAEDVSSTTQPIPYLAGDPNDNGLIYDDTPAGSGTEFTAVGFGVTQDGVDDSGTKRTVQLRMKEIYLDIFEYGSSSQNTCSGDSGGPALLNVSGTTTVIGVVSYGDPSCTSFGGDSRTDYFSGYIAQFAGAGATPTPTPGPGDDDDDGTTPGDDDEDDGGNGADDPLGNIGCSIAGATGLARSPIGFLALLAMAGFVTRRRK